MITSIGGALWIDNNNALTSLIGLNALTSIGTAYILNNPALTSLTGINSLSFIWGTLGLQETPYSKFNSTKFIDHIQIGLSFYFQQRFTQSLTGLDNIDSDSIHIFTFMESFTNDLSGEKYLCVFSKSLWCNRH